MTNSDISRSERLLTLLQILRQYRNPVSGAKLAQKIGVSIRTLYRDIASLQTMGAMIEGEPGVGYILKSGFMLPPLMFTTEEIEAIVLGSRWVSERTDSDLRNAAQSAMAKIASVVPTTIKEELETSTLVIGYKTNIPTNMLDISSLRKSIRLQKKIIITYCDATNRVSDRIIWPFALAFFDSVRILIAWCEVRHNFRHFRTDRIISIQTTDVIYSKSRRVLFKEWCESEGITKKFY